MPAAQQEYDAIMSISNEIEGLSVQENPYTSLTKEVNRSVRSVAKAHLQCVTYVLFLKMH